MFFLIPKIVTSERPIALMPTLIRRWEVLRAPEVAKWQLKCRVDWDATSGRNGGAQQTVWEILLETDRFNGGANEEDQGALALVLDVAKAVELVSLPVVWAWATHFSSQGRYCECCAGTLSTRRGCSLKDVQPRVQVELFAVAYCVARCIERRYKKLPCVEVEGFCG